MSKPIGLRQLLIIGGFIALCLFMFNVSKSYGKTVSQSGCETLENAKIQIEDKHGEKLIFRGISARGHVTFIYYNTTSSTWTAAIIRPETTDMLCLVDAGLAGEIMEIKDSKNKIKW